MRMELPHFLTKSVVYERFGMGFGNEDIHLAVENFSSSSYGIERVRIDVAGAGTLATRACKTYVRGATHLTRPQYICSLPMA